MRYATLGLLGYETLIRRSFPRAAPAGVAPVRGGIQLRSGDPPGRVAELRAGRRTAGRTFALLAGLARSPDLDADGTVGPADLAGLLARWGSVDPAADLGGDGLVGVEDLAVLLGGGPPS